MVATVLSLKQAEAMVPDATRAKMREKAEDFESFFVYQMVELMSPDDNNSVFNGGAGERMFRHQLNEELAKSMSKGGGFGIADSVYGQLIRNQTSQELPVAVSRMRQQAAYQQVQQESVLPTD